MHHNVWENITPLTEEEKSFIKANMMADTFRLVLDNKDRLPNIAALAMQIEARQRAAKKLPSLANNFDIIFPATIPLQQSSSEATADYKAALAGQGVIAIDLCGGFGADTFALARRFDKMIYVERDPGLCELMRHNAQALGLANIEVMNSSAEDFLATYEDHADLIYLDPARRGGGNKKLVSLSDLSPDVTKLMSALQQAADRIMIKASPMLDTAQARRELGAPADAYIIESEGECRELLLLAGGDAGNALTAVVLGKETFELRYPAESYETVYGSGGAWLYEPSPAIMKAARFDFLTHAHGLRKAAPDTHLFYSDEPTVLPGKRLRVISDSEADKHTLEKYRKGNYSVITRNYFLSAEEIRRKLSLGESDIHYLAFFRDVDGKGRAVEGVREN